MSEIGLKHVLLSLPVYNMITIFMQDVFMIARELKFILYYNFLINQFVFSMPLCARVQACLLQVTIDGYSSRLGFFKFKVDFLTVEKTKETIKTLPRVQFYLFIELWVLLCLKFGFDATLASRKNCQFFGHRNSDEFGKNTRFLALED